ncbi:hypothetical protein DPMN_064646 [Dreissena polymorpha]|uniref:Uncharacterized protein n=1 Tax=Dreissena polymorpha TaxID=45954 RepID=A0A9D4HLB4_DREPO|nr:hypothetical protein DPMN_064646 [Dreissena polymorpha]
MRWCELFWINSTVSDVCNRPVIHDCFNFCYHCLKCLEVNGSHSKHFLDGSFHNSDKPPPPATVPRGFFVEFTANSFLSLSMLLEWWLSYIGVQYV